MSEKEALLPTKRIFATYAPSKGAQMRNTTQTLSVVTSHLAHLQHSKSLEKHENKEKLFELNV